MHKMNQKLNLFILVLLTIIVYLIYANYSLKKEHSSLLNKYSSATSAAQGKRDVFFSKLYFQNFVLNRL